MLEEYTLEEPKQQGRSPDSLIQAIDRIERLEKQLGIAVRALEKYADDKNWIPGHSFCDVVFDLDELNIESSEELATQALEEINELEDKNKVFTYMGKPVDAMTYLEKKIEYERKELEK